MRLQSSVCDLFHIRNITIIPIDLIITIDVVRSGDSTISANIRIVYIYIRAYIYKWPTTTENIYITFEAF